jgi:hypothetical protein
LLGIGTLDRYPGGGVAGADKSVTEFGDYWEVITE